MAAPMTVWSCRTLDGCCPSVCLIPVAFEPKCVRIDNIMNSNQIGREAQTHWSNNNILLPVVKENQNVNLLTSGPFVQFIQVVC